MFLHDFVYVVLVINWYLQNIEAVHDIMHEHIYIPNAVANMQISFIYHSKFMLEINRHKVSFV